MKKYIFYFLAFFIFLLILNIDVNALGINNGVKGYVRQESLIYNNNNLCTSSGKKCLGYFYSLKNDGNASAYCLDPGLFSPNSGYKYYRELDLEASSDIDFYKAYLYYANNITAGGNLIDIKNKTDVVLRLIINKYNYNLSRARATRDEQFNGTNGIADYMNGKINFKNINWNLGGNVQGVNGNCRYWVGVSDENSCKSIFEDYKIYYNGFKEFSDYWTNPIKITPTVEYKKVTDENDSYYTFNFEINFKGENNNFFDYGNYNNGYGQNAYFRYSLGNINDAYALTTGETGNVIDYSGNGEITSSVDKVNIFVKIKETVFNAIKESSQDGKVFVKLNYEYYHPLNPDNVYLNSERATSHETTSYQRMIVFDNFVNSGTEVLSDEGVGETPPPEEMSVCIHNSNNTFNGKYGDSVSLETFKSQCGCNKIEETLLNVSQKEYFKSECKRTSSIEVSNNIKKCNIYSSHENYEIIYKKVEAINDYCSKTCIETINFNDVTNSYAANDAAKAGQFFKLDMYPTLIADKKCNVDVDYNEWKINYSNALRIMVEKYNDWRREVALNSTTPSSNCCNGFYTNSGSYVCTANKYTYSTSYNGYMINSDGVTVTPTYGNSASETSSCGGKLTFNPNIKSQEFINTFADVETLQSSLKICSTELNKLTDELFYNFKQDLNYYYEQTYSDKKIGSRLNNERKSLGGIDDSELDFEKTNEKNTKIKGEPYVYDSISSTGAELSVSLNDSIKEREIKYKYEYKPAVKKYVDAFSGEISTSEEYLNNPIELGYVYDLDVSAVAKNDNNNYFKFYELGDNNQIYNYFKNRGPYKVYSFDTKTQIGNESNLERACTYKITNELIETCDSAVETCLDSEGGSPHPNEIYSELNLVYRIVDPSNIDPNGRLDTVDDGRLDTVDGFKNWITDEARAVKANIESKAVGNNTYNPSNLEYSFELDSADLQEIRTYNESHNYSDFNLDCNSDGNKCESVFVEGYAIKDKFNKIVGRSRWKEYEKRENGKCYIDGKLVKCSN